MPHSVPDDHPALLDLLAQESSKTLRTSGVLRSSFGHGPVFVDNPEEPRAVLVQQGTFYAFYCSDLTRGAELLDQALDWTQPHGFAGLHETFLPLIEQRSALDWSSPCAQYHLPPHACDALLEDREIPSSVQHLTPDDAVRVLTHWPYGDPQSDRDIALMRDRIERGITAAWIEGTAPISWAMLHHDASLGCMHTLKSWRRQGIGVHVARTLLKRTVHAGYIPHCHVVADNSDPRGLLQTLSMQRDAGAFYWLGTVPRSRT